MRPGELIAHEHRDTDREALIVYVRRAYRNGRLKCPKTDGSLRAVPLHAIAIEALDTVATFALRAGISTFDLSRYMGASLTMIDRHYGHLAKDGRQHAIRLLDSYADTKGADVQAMDVRWTPDTAIVAGHDNANST